MYGEWMDCDGEKNTQKNHEITKKCADSKFTRDAVQDHFYKKKNKKKTTA